VTPTNFWKLKKLLTYFHRVLLFTNLHVEEIVLHVLNAVYVYFSYLFVKQNVTEV